MVIYRRWEKTLLLESLISVWEYLFNDFVLSRSNPPVVIVLPSPKWYLTA